MTRVKEALIYRLTKNKLVQWEPQIGNAFFGARIPQINLINRPEKDLGDWKAVFASTLLKIAKISRVLQA